MTPDRVVFHIDNSIKEKIQSGCRWNVIIEDLKDKVNRYKKRDAFINVSERYLINNWSRIEWKKRMTTMIVIQSANRVKDIEWIKKTHHKFPQYGSVGMLNLLKLRDKVLYNFTTE